MPFKTIIKNIENSIKYIFLSTFILQFSCSFSQEEDSKTFIDSYGIGINNNIYFPETIYNEKGLIEKKGKFRYGYEISFNYNMIFKNNFGVKTDIFLFSTIPNGNTYLDPNEITENYKWLEYENPENIFNNMHYNPFDLLNGIPYLGLDLLINYSFKLGNIIIQPDMGARFLFVIPHKQEISINTYSTNNISKSIIYEYVDSYNNPIFFPDLVFNLNFLLLNNISNHNLKLGLGINLGLIPRAEGFFEITNMGKSNSSGTIKYGSSYFGFNIGYQFLGIHNQEKQTETEKIIFNPRY